MNIVILHFLTLQSHMELCWFLVVWKVLSYNKQRGYIFMLLIVMWGHHRILNTYYIKETPHISFKCFLMSGSNPRGDAMLPSGRGHNWGQQLRRWLASEFDGTPPGDALLLRELQVVMLWQRCKPQISSVAVKPCSVFTKKEFRRVFL